MFGDRGRLVKKTMAVLMTAAFAFVAVARGEVLCLCDEDPDDCGHACHECGTTAPDGIGGSESCHHLDLTVDLAPTGDDTVLPIGDIGAPFLPSAFLSQPTDFRPVVLCATSPPPLRPPSAYCSYSSRLFPRS